MVGREEHKRKARAARERERQRIEDMEKAQRAHDRRPLSPGFCGTCRQTRDGGGLPEGEEGGIPAGITHDLVLQFDLPARRMEHEERLLAMNGGDVNKTLYEMCVEGWAKDARFLLAHGADANYPDKNGSHVLWRTASIGHLAVVEALLDAGADQLGNALEGAAAYGRTAVVALLLDRGADIHFEDDNALMYAAVFDLLELATLLLERGATAQPGLLTYIVSEGQDAMAEVMRAHAAV